MPTLQQSLLVLKTEGGSWVTLKRSLFKFETKLLLQYK